MALWRSVAMAVRRPAGAALQAHAEAGQGVLHVASRVVAVPASHHFFATEGKESIKSRDEPTMGTTTQEGSEGHAEKTKEANLERAREGGEKVREADGVEGTAKAAGDVAKDVGKGVKQFGEKVGDMTKEAAQRAKETAKGAMGSKD
eukprot:SM000038S14336  [mRNA]  locus=s38:333984:334790:+ [translate_table: standard]